MTRADPRRFEIDKLKRTIAEQNRLAYAEWFQERFAEHYQDPEGHGVVETIRRMSDATIYKCACGEEVVVTGMEAASFGL